MWQHQVRFIQEEEDQADGSTTVAFYDLLEASSGLQRDLRRMIQYISAAAAAAKQHDDGDNAAEVAGGGKLVKSSHMLALLVEERWPSGIIVL
jgi:hypothetical protein